MKQRLEYNENSRSAFVELHPSFYPTLSEFKECLEAVLGVERVVWHPRRMDQQNLLVYSNIAGRSSASRPIEFELKRGPTLTAMVKDPPVGLIGEAWRILLEVTNGKQLLPEHVQDYYTRHVTRWESDAPVHDRAQSSHAADDAPVSDSAQSSSGDEGSDEEGDDKESDGEDEWEPLTFAPQIPPRSLQLEEEWQPPDMRPRWASKEAFFEDLAPNREERKQIIAKWEQLAPGGYMRIGEDGPYRHGTYIRAAVEAKKGNLRPGTCTTGGMPPGGLYMAKNADMAARYPMLLDWDVGEVPYPGCFPVRMVLTLSCKEAKTVKRRGPNSTGARITRAKE